MFQIEPILFLQSLENPVLTAIMRGISFVGNAEFVLPLLLVFTLAVDIRRGFAILHIVLWTAVATSILKVLFSLPRPYVADFHVLMLEDNASNLTPFDHAGASHFMGALPLDVIEYHRSNGLSNGFPSGHASIAMALWGSLALLNRSRLMGAGALALIVLTPLSRMYLGKHFLADVLGGIVLGAAVLFACILIVRTGRFHAVLSNATIRTDRTLETVIITAYLLAVPWLLLEVPDSRPEWMGALLGLNLAFLLLWRRGFPAEGGRLTQRVSRTLLGVVLFVVTNEGLKFLGISQSSILDLTRSGLSAFLLLWGSVTISSRAGLYAAAPSPSGHG